MKTNFKVKVLAASIALVTGSALASTINVGGVVWDPDSFFDFRTTDFMIEGIVTNPGDILYGYGNISTLNGSPSFCPGCELTYTFTYTLQSASALQYTFKLGSMKVYVDNTPNFNSLSALSASDGILFLDLAGHSHYDLATGSGPADLFSTPTPSPGGPMGNGRGFLDVVGGIAAANFNTNTQLAYQGLDNSGAPTYDMADFTFTSSFQRLQASFTSDDGRTYSMFGSNDLQGNSIPEPGTLALAGLSLLGLGFARRRKNAN